MSPAMQIAPVSTKSLWTGRVISALPILLLLFSGIMKLMKPASVLEGFARFGYPENLIVIIALLEIGSTIIYAIPRTSILGAILLTGYLGGATATNVRLGDPSYIMTVILGMLVWLGLYLRDARVRALLPLKND
jgi:hypothetical protein